MEPFQSLGLRRLQTLSGHFSQCHGEDGPRAPANITTQACAELAAVRACRRTKDVVYYTEEGGERMRRCQTTHQVVSREFILKGRPEASDKSKAQRDQATSPCAPPPSPLEDDDFLPPSLVYMDSWLPETPANHNTPPPERTESREIRPLGQNGGKGTCGGSAGKCGGKGTEKATAGQAALANLGAEWEPKMDVLESPTTFVVSLELPGVPVEGVRVELRDDSLVIKGSRPPQAWSNHGGHITFGPADERNGHAVYHRRELAQGPYHASWTVPDGCDYDGISAEFADGVLSVVIPKKAAPKRAA